MAAIRMELGLGREHKGEHLVWCVRLAQLIYRFTGLGLAPMETA